MAQSIPFLTWQPWNRDLPSYVTTVPIDFSADGEWIVSMVGNNQWTPDNVIPKFVLIDNINNDGVVTINFGPFELSVSQFSRETYEIPPTVQRLIFTGTAGTLNVIFSTEKLAENNTNDLAIQQATGANVQIPVLVKTVGPMLITDGGRQLVFQPIANINFNLLSIGANQLPNGFFIYVQNLSNFTVSLVPNGTDTINTFFTNAVPMVLHPGSSGILRTDGVNWFFTGNIFWQSAEIVLATSSLQTIVHNLGRRLFRTNVYLRCKAAQSNYAIGDEISIGGGFAGGSVNYCFMTATFLTEIKFVQGSVAPTVNAGAPGGGTFVPTPANWRWFLRAMVKW